MPLDTTNRPTNKRFLEQLFLAGVKQSNLVTKSYKKAREEYFLKIQQHGIMTKKIRSLKFEPEIILQPGVLNNFFAIFVKLNTQPSPPAVENPTAPPCTIDEKSALEGEGENQFGQYWSARLS